MANEIVCYKNDFNTVPLRNFNSKEMDLLFSICSRIREQGNISIELTFEDLKELSDYKMTATKHFIKDIENIYDKLINLNFKVGTDTEFTKFVLFNKYSVSETKGTVTVSVNDEFKYILNELTQNFTKFELEEFTNLRSSYSKTAYRLLKQFRSTGYVIFEIQEFKNLLCIPEKYQMSDIDKKVFKYIKRELSECFDYLKINKLKKGKSRKITHIEFTFNPESNIKNKVEETILLEEKNENLELKEKINTIKNVIPILSEDDVRILIENADIPIILEKYYTLAVGKDIDNLTGFLMAAIKNNWKKAPSKTVEKKAVDGEMDELERRLQKRLFEKLNQLD